MGQVIYDARLGSHQIAVPDSVLPKDVRYESTKQLRDDFHFFIANDKLVLDAFDRGLKIRRRIQHLVELSRSNEAIEILRRGLEGTSLECLCDSLLSTGEREWRSSPSLYGAIMFEIVNRSKAIEEFLITEEEMEE